MRKSSIFTITRTFAAAAVMVGSPIFAAAQHQMAQSAPGGDTTEPARSAALTREQVRADVEKAMQDGMWRCRTSSRGWCTNEPVPTAKPDAIKRP